MLLKKIRWTFKRHPLLYKARFWLLSKNSNTLAIASISYNGCNRKHDIPNFFYKINSQIFSHGTPNSDLELIKQLVCWLDKYTKVGPGISEASDKALETMLYGKGGVCSDMAQIFNNFCVINDIKVREWGTTSAPFNPKNGGHSFNEVYVRELQKWLLVDSSWGGIFYDEKDKPLSVIELYQLSRSGKLVYYRSFIEGEVVEKAYVAKNYLDNEIIPFLICEYRNKTYDLCLRLGRPYVPVFFIHFAIYLIGQSYHYKFPLDDYKKIFI